VIGHQLDRYPFPVAYPARMLAVASDRADRLEKANHFVELVAATLGVLALGWCRAHGVSADGVRQWERKLDPSGIALGTWIAMVRSASNAMAGSPHEPVARAIRLSAVAALPALEGYTPVRNVYAHGGKPRLRLDQEAAVADLGAAVSVILDGIEPLTGIRFGVIRSCRGLRGSFELDLDVLAGHGEPFAARRMPCRVRHEQGAVLAYHAASADFAVDLTPFCVWALCPSCRRDELFYLHQRRKQQGRYFSFSTGHELISKDPAKAAAGTTVQVSAQPLGSARAAAAGWRATWAGLASRPRRLAARAVDLTLTALAAMAGALVAVAAGMSLLAGGLLVGLPLALLYEPLTALTGGTPGKRLLRIEPVSVWDSRALGRADRLRRALAVDVQILFPPLAIRNLPWLLWDPARQCWHDRVTDSIIVAGRSRHGHKR
jgi:hypothetical protein